MTKPAVLVARAIFPEVIAKLEQHFTVEHNQADEAWSREQQLAKRQGKAGAFTTGGERIDADLLKACPGLRIVANMAVAITSAKPKSAVVSVSTSGVLVPSTFAAVIAFRSKLL